MMKGIKLGILFMLLAMISTVHATPIDNFIVIENIPSSIIGGNYNHLVVEYDSIDTDVVFKFSITSMFPFLNNTPEIGYLKTKVNDTELNCLNTTIDDDKVFVSECYYHLTAGRHNTTVTFAFAPSIAHNKYEFDFNILHYEVPVQTYLSSGSSSRSTPYTKTVTVTVVREWLNSTEPVGNRTINVTDNESEIEYELKLTLNSTNTTAEVIASVTETEKDYSNVFLVIFFILCGIVFLFIYKKL